MKDDARDNEILEENNDILEENNDINTENEDITEDIPEKKVRKKKKGPAVIISSIVAAILVCTILISTALTLLLGVGVMALGGLGTMGLVLFGMSDPQDITVNTTPEVNVDVGMDEEMFVTKLDGSDTEQGNTEDAIEMTIAQVIERVADTVVEITTVGSAYDVLLGQAVGSAGSGVIISENGYIITNHHVIDGAATITVRLTNGHEYKAGVVGSDADNDIALLKIKATGLPAAVLGSSKDIVVGQEVVAIGNPLGTLGGTVTNGIISAIDSTIEIDGHSMTLLQTNAAINPGNSGGGLFNLSGELIGIVNAKQSDLGIEGLGFAIPIDMAWNTVQEISENS